MGCDIHLRLEIRLKKDKKWNDYYTEKAGEWKPCRILGHDECWGDRIYGMFAVLANVRNYSDLKHIPLRGFPDDACNCTRALYGLRVLEKVDDDSPLNDGVCDSKNAEKWVREGISRYFYIGDTKYVTNPDWHSPNWCTTQEMEDCINTIFKDEKGEWQGDYVEWIALLGAMKGYEASGEYECRAVFWFDN